MKRVGQDEGPAQWRVLKCLDPMRPKTGKHIEAEIGMCVGGARTRCRELVVLGLAITDKFGTKEKHYWPTAEGFWLTTLPEMQALSILRRRNAKYDELKKMRAWAMAPEKEWWVQHIDDEMRKVR